MSDDPKKTADGAEKAYAAAAAKVNPTSSAPATDAVKGAEPKAAPKPKPGKAAKIPVRPAAVEKAAAPAPKKKAPVRKPAAPTVPVPAAAQPAPAAAAPAAPVEEISTPPVPTLSELKETIMATAPQTDDITEISQKMTNTMNEAVSEMQNRTKAVYEKGAETMTELTEFAKGNLEALVESSRIFAGGMQDLGKTYADEAKSAYETMTADVKEMAAVKSPTELFQLQGKIARRNFDAMVAATSKHTEAMIKLANESFAPLSGRMNVAAEKFTRAA